MKLCHSLSALRRVKKSIRLAAGFFDGVHRGHQAVIRRVIRNTLACGEEPWIMTFDIHPLKLLQPHAAPPLLTSTEHRIRLLESYGVQNCVILAFTRAMAEAPPEVFIARLVRAVRDLRGIVVGSNWTFGKNGSGTPELLQILGAHHGFEVDIVHPVRWQNAPVSSTRIRQAVAAGMIEEAAAMLGRFFSVSGSVVSGRGIGRELGFPTANIKPRNEVLPGNGVYAVRVGRIDGRFHDGVANIGVRPTFKDGRERKKNLEAHLFDARLNLYGREIEVFFVRKLRDEKRFAAPEDLKAQIIQDIKLAKIVLAQKKAKNVLYKETNPLIMPSNKKTTNRKKWNTKQNPK